MMATMSSSQTVTDMILSFNGTTISIHVPAGYTNETEIYATDDLDNRWTLAATGLTPTEGFPAIWTVPNGPVRFFRSGNSDIDSDEDGLPDTRELIVHDTDPNEFDSDNDLHSDYQEIHQLFTDPNNNDTSLPIVSLTAPQHCHEPV